MSSRWVGLIRTSPSLYAGAHGTNPNLQIECVGLENCREFAQAAHKADSVNRTMIAQDAASMNLNLWRWSAQFAWNAKMTRSSERKDPFKRATRRRRFGQGWLLGTKENRKASGSEAFRFKRNDMVIRRLVQGSSEPADARPCSDP